jgi:hypothetical protein
VQRGSFRRLPTDYEINASLGYTIKIAPVTQDIPGSPDEFYGSFDKAITRGAPRQLRFGARISF